MNYKSISNNKKFKHLKFKNKLNTKIYCKKLTINLKKLQQHNNILINLVIMSLKIVKFKKQSYSKAKKTVKNKMNA